ncbi:hypothetical protein SUVZ_16G0280 [Saccharomyces uvarum]|uniref:Uncharacterized protein n=1 Tax=Saccharomyces uvarum TaxID=230603 RepID=A0ABN8WSK5_SACUV|nr:hypothetical protein SUVZ_16G0280 [Saccharomyces uvarum]
MASGLGPDADGGSQEFAEVNISVELGRPYHPPPFSTMKRSDVLGVTGFDKGKCAGEDFYIEHTESGVTGF